MYLTDGLSNRTGLNLCTERLGQHHILFSQVAWVSVTFAYPVSPLSCNSVGGGLYTMVTGRVSTLQLVPFEFHCWLGLQTKGKHRYAELLLATSRPIVHRDGV